MVDREWQHVPRFHKIIPSKSNLVRLGNGLKPGGASHLMNPVPVQLESQVENALNEKRKRLLYLVALEQEAKIAATG
ncbi:hypothetical protein Xclt_15185 [Xanthomonas axonopodis pv. clitoriae]|uniref:Transposase n=1 Tax=Xanthomonas axonopodis pv. clitoriae TaxID=487828 RepID=A0AB73N8B9_9XANT|nr:hypothetical protein Xclt_15185 [Xanthomonas axonopodis pv. clitoriae]